MQDLLQVSGVDRATFWFVGNKSQVDQPWRVRFASMAESGEGVVEIGIELRPPRPPRVQPAAAAGANADGSLHLLPRSSDSTCDPEPCAFAFGAGRANGTLLRGFSSPAVAAAFPDDVGEFGPCFKVSAPSINAMLLENGETIPGPHELAFRSVDVYMCGKHPLNELSARFRETDNQVGSKMSWWISCVKAATAAADTIREEIRMPTTAGFRAVRIEAEGEKMRGVRATEAQLVRFQERLKTIADHIFEDDWVRAYAIPLETLVHGIGEVLDLVELDAPADRRPGAVLTLKARLQGQALRQSAGFGIRHRRGFGFRSWVPLAEGRGLLQVDQQAFPMERACQIQLEEDRAVQQLKAEKSAAQLKVLEKLASTTLPPSLFRKFVMRTARAIMDLAQDGGAAALGNALRDRQP